MNHSHRRTWGCCLLLALVATGGCARDGGYEPQGSLKDSPEPTVSSQPLRPRAVAKAPVKRILPLAASRVENPPAQAREVAEPKPVSPAPGPITAPSRTSSPLASPALKAPPPMASVQPVRRPPISGAQFLEEGRLLFKSGEVLAARERYVAALSAPLPEVLLELARTYDPNYLDRLPKSDADADRDRARALYEQATSLGSKLAEQDLARLLGTGASVTPR